MSILWIVTGIIGIAIVLWLVSRAVDSGKKSPKQTPMEDAHQETPRDKY